MNDFKKCFSEYDLVCKLEELELNRRFLPYSIGSPKRSVTYDDAYERANILFFSDSHIDFRNPVESLDNVRRTIEYSNSSPVTFDAVVNCGDAITPFQVRPKEDAYARFTPFFDEMKKSRSPVIYSMGNHDLNDWGNYPQNAFDDTDLGKLFFDYAEENFGIVRQAKDGNIKSSWHYYDIESKKIRIVSVNIQDSDKETVNEEGKVRFYSTFYVSQKQMQWICDTALNFDDKEEKDWGVIFALHQIPRKKHEEYPDAGEILIKLCSAFNKGEKFTYSFTSEEFPFFNLDMDYNFSRYHDMEKKPHMICWLLGHDHEDIVEVKEGINLIWTLNNSASTCCSDARIARVLGTSTQNSFDIVNIDTRERKIRIFKYGAGVNCYGVGGDRFVPDGLDY